MNPLTNISVIIILSIGTIVAIVLVLEMISLKRIGQNIKKEDISWLEYHCSDVNRHETPFLLIKTKTDDVRVIYATEFRKIYEYCTNNKIKIYNY